jgi:HipA-like protein
MLPEKIPLLALAIGDNLGAGQLLRKSIYEFRYLSPAAQQPSVALLMPASTQLTWQDGDLFPSMDQNLPEGDLFMRIRALFPKQPTTPMHLLALIGRNGIGRLGYTLPEHPLAAPVGNASTVQLECRYLLAGDNREHNRSIALGCPLSPLLGGLHLADTDRAISGWARRLGRLADWSGNPWYPACFGAGSMARLHQLAARQALVPRLGRWAGLARALRSPGPGA